MTYQFGIGGLDMRKTVSFLNRFWNDESGAAAAEYVIILAIIGSALAERCDRDSDQRYRDLHQLERPHL
jgi:hypothetical protein